MATRKCSVASCDRKHHCKSYCEMHYRRVREHGTPELRKPTLEERFWRNVIKSDDCWTWTASHYASGYAVFNRGYGHRYAYEFCVGPIPEGHQVDHICHNRGCVNPSHLRPATNKQNNEHQAGLHRNNTSGYRGVSLHKASGLWVAFVGHEGRRLCVGYFKDPAEAGEAARRKRLELFTHNDLDRFVA